MEFQFTGLLVLLHVLFASLWFGGGIYQVAIIGRGLMAAGPAGGGFVAALMKNGGIGRYFALSGALAILFGGWLYGDMKIYDAPFEGRNLWITIGAAIAVLALLHGAIVNMPNERRLMAVVNDLKGPPTKEQAAQMQELGMKLGKNGVHSVLLVALAMMLMLLSRVLV